MTKPERLTKKQLKLLDDIYEEVQENPTHWVEVLAIEYRTADSLVRRGYLESNKSEVYFEVRLTKKYFERP